MSPTYGLKHAAAQQIFLGDRWCLLLMCVEECQKGKPVTDQQEGEGNAISPTLLYTLHSILYTLQSVGVHHPNSRGHTETWEPITT